MSILDIDSDDAFFSIKKVFSASIENQLHVSDFRFNVLHNDEATGKQINEFLERVWL